MRVCVCVYIIFLCGRRRKIKCVVCMYVCIYMSGKSRGRGCQRNSGKKNNCITES